MKEAIADWFEMEVKKLGIDEALYIRVLDTKEQTEVALEMEKEKSKLAKIDPLLSNQLFVNKVKRDDKFYVTIRRRYRTPFVGFKQNSKGIFSKITIDPERRRIIELMVKDGKSKTEVEETLGGLTDEELQKYFT